MVVSAVDQEQLARKIRVVHIHRLGGFTPVDGVLIWIIHSLVATAIILFLVQTNVLPMDWDLRPFFHEQRVVSSQVVEGGFFFAFAPICVLTGDSFSPMCLRHLGSPPCLSAAPAFAFWELQRSDMQLCHSRQSCFCSRVCFLPSQRTTWAALKPVSSFRNVRYAAVPIVGEG